MSRLTVWNRATGIRARKKAMSTLGTGWSLRAQRTHMYNPLAAERRGECGVGGGVKLGRTQVVWVRRSHRDRIDMRCSFGSGSFVVEVGVGLMTSYANMCHVCECMPVQVWAAHRAAA